MISWRLVQYIVNKLKKDTNVPKDKVKSAMEFFDMDGKNLLFIIKFQIMNKFKIFNY